MEKCWVRRKDGEDEKEVGKWKNEEEWEERVGKGKGRGAEEEKRKC